MFNPKKTYNIAIKIVLLLAVLSPFSACSAGVEDTTIRIRPLQITAEGADTIENNNIIAYLFIADTTTHHFESFDDALAGKITEKANDLKIDYYLKAEKDAPYDYLIFPETKEKLLVGVACDTRNKIYYYRNIITEKNDVYPEFLYIDVIMKPYLFDSDIDVVDKQKNWVGKQ